MKTEYLTQQQFALTNFYTNNLCLLPTIEFYIKYLYVYWKWSRDTLQLLCYYIALNKWIYLWLQILHRCFEQTHIERRGRIHTQDKRRENEPHLQYYHFCICYQRYEYQPSDLSQCEEVASALNWAKSDLCLRDMSILIYSSLRKDCLNFT